VGRRPRRVRIDPTATAAGRDQRPGAERPSEHAVDSAAVLHRWGAPSTEPTIAIRPGLGAVSGNRGRSGPFPAVQGRSRPLTRQPRPVPPSSTVRPGGLRGVRTAGWPVSARREEWPEERRCGCSSRPCGAGDRVRGRPPNPAPPPGHARILGGMLARHNSPNHNCSATQSRRARSISSCRCSRPHAVTYRRPSRPRPCGSITVASGSSAP